MIRPIYPEPGPAIADLAGELLGDTRIVVGRPWVMVNMVNSIDGATAVDGRATGLTDADDQALFHAFRAMCDVVLVGASTVRAEDYGPIILDEGRTRARLAVGMSAAPRLAVVSRSLDLDVAARVFADPGNRPVVFTVGEADQSRLEELAAVAELVEAGDEDVDLARALTWLGANGHSVVLCEGGPSINGQLLLGDLVDEINLSTSPVVVSGSSPRLARSLHPVAEPMPFRLDRQWVGDKMIFARWLRDR